MSPSPLAPNLTINSSCSSAGSRAQTGLGKYVISLVLIVACNALLLCKVLDLMQARSTRSARVPLPL